MCRPRRSNSARLLILADASPKHGPVAPPPRHPRQLSLPLGRLARAEVRYFSNQPRRHLYATSALTDPEPRYDVLRRHAGAALLVVSDAGSAGAPSTAAAPSRPPTSSTKPGACSPPPCGSNPMPRQRWAGTTAASSPPAGAHAAGGRPACLRAIDILRGNK